jgi:hypothetical protein
VANGGQNQSSTLLTIGQNIVTAINSLIKIFVPGGISGNVLYNKSGVIAGMSGTAWDDTSKTMTFNGANTSLLMSPSAGPGLISLNPQAAAKQARIDFYQSGVVKWSLGKQTDDTFFLFDSVASHGVLGFASGSPGLVQVLNSNLTVSSGASTAVTPIQLLDTIPGSTLRVGVTNTTTANNSTAGYLVSTNVANAFGILEINNQVANPQLDLGFGPGVTGGLNLNNSGVSVMLLINGVQVGAPTGGDKGAGTINVATNIFKNNTAYNNPDYVLEYHFTGKIERFANNDGAAAYRGRLNLDDLERYTKENLRLPGITDEPAGIFTMADIALEKIEELTLYIFELHKRLKYLEDIVERANLIAHVPLKRSHGADHEHL